MKASEIPDNTKTEAASKPVKPRKNPSPSGRLEETKPNVQPMPGTPAAKVDKAIETGRFNSKEPNQAAEPKEDATAKLPIGYNLEETALTPKERQMLDKANIVQQLLTSARLAIEETIQYMPENWTAQELRQYVADYFINQAGTRKMHPSKMRAYKKARAERPLL